MNVTEFEDTLNHTEPPAVLSAYATALWWDGKGDWHQAHDVVQNLSTPEAAWVHAYLHRKEGDTRNADYWYPRAGRKRPQDTLKDEWRELVKAFI